MAQGGSGVGDALADMVNNIGRAIAHHHGLPPREKAIARAELGAGLLVIAAYGVVLAKPLTGDSPGELVAAALRAPAPPTDIWLPLAAWAAAVLLGFIWLVVGICGANGPRHGMNAFWAAIRIAIYIGIIYWTAPASGADLSRWITPLVGLLDATLIVFLAGDLVRFVLELRGGGSARHLVAQQIQHNAVIWRPARRRRWWQWW